jgi:hypothetical protein
MIARIAALSLFIGAAFGQTSAQVAFTANSPRPLWDVVRQLEHQYGWRITYEDPPYESPLDLDNTVAPAYLATHPGAAFLAPRPQPFTANIAGSVPSHYAAAGDAGATGLIQSAIDAVVAQATINGTKGFRVVHDGDFSHVTPTQYRKKDGTLAPLTPVLDTLVTLAPARRSVEDAVNLVCTQVAATRGIPIADGVVLTNLYHRVELTYADHEPARVVLSRILEDTNAERVSDGAPALRITWDLLYDANEKSYFLSTHAILQ